MRSMTTADADPSPAPGSSGRTLARAQFALAAVYVSAIGVALGRAASFSGYLYLPQQGDEYTGNADLWPGLWAPAALAMIVVIGVAPYVAAVAAVVAVTRLLTAGMRTSGHRRSLILGTVLAALVAASSLTPPVKVLFSWLLD
jgi:predicted lysophospholipase L1 biosynthesis ABC-type transport system permease subunit